MSFKANAVLVIPLLVFFVLLLPLKDGFTDDGFIHIQYARNIVTQGEYSFNPGEDSFGTTSPLWVMVHAALGRVLGTGEVLIFTSRALSWLCGFLIVVAVFFLARALGLRMWAAFFCSLFIAGHAWLVRWTALGMETSSAVLAIVVVGLVSVRAFDSRQHAWRLGFFMAVAALLRPEAYLLLPVYLAAVTVRGRRNDWGCVVRVLLVYVLLVAPWLAFAKYHIGSFLPNTAGAKSGGLIADPVALIQKFGPIVKIVGSTDGLAAVVLLSSIVFAFKRTRMLSDTHRFLLFWVVALPVAYVVFDIQVLSRYMLLTSPFTIVLGFSALEGWVDRIADASTRERARRIAPALLAVIALAGNIVFYIVVVVPPSAAFSHDLTHNLKNLAVFIRENSAEDAVVAAADIGYLAFYSRRWVLDLGGLVDNETLALREEHTYEEIVEKGMYLRLPKYPSVDFFIDRELTANRFDEKVIEGYRFDSVLVTEVRNLGIRKPGPYFYTLYRLTPYNDEPF